jgi:hypothetical protein
VHCAYCKKGHQIQECDEFKARLLEHRKEFTITQKLCKICLKTFTEVSAEAINNVPHVVAGTTRYYTKGRQRNLKILRRKQKAPTHPQKIK